MNLGRFLFNPNDRRVHQPVMVTTNQCSFYGNQGPKAQGHPIWKYAANKVVWKAVWRNETVRHFEPSELMYSLQHATYLMGLAADSFMQETATDNENNYWMMLHLYW